MAVEFMARLRAGITIRKLTGGGKCAAAMVSCDRFKKHCELNPEWGAEAVRLAKQNQQAALRATVTVTVDLARERSAARAGSRKKKSTV
jgi:hypothetical protein